MLSYEAFGQGLEEVENTYVNRRFHLNDSQKEQWYKLLNRLNDESYLEAINEWCSSKNVLPSPADLLEISGRLRVATDNSVSIPKNKEHCKICLDTGVIRGYYFNKELQSKYEYVCCCICEAGDYCKSIYPLPQANRNKLSREMQDPTKKQTEMPNIDLLIKQMSMEEALKN